jgi:hypothetical protein
MNVIEASIVDATNLSVGRSPSAPAAAKIIEDIAQFFRSEWQNKETFEGWPFLPEQAGKQPSAAQANAFLLGCCIDYHQLTRTAWRKAAEFCNERVGVENLDRLWHWIAQHDARTWASRFASYGYLHPTPVRHRKLHSIAKTLVDHYDGDARQLWQKQNVGRLTEILQDELAVGPQITRMIIGGLRDHQLVEMKTSDLKADVQVVRLMNAMGLSHTTNPKQVVEDARRWFKDPWVADTALYHLGSTYGAKTKIDVLRIYRAICQWREVRTTTEELVSAMVGELKREYRGVIQFYAASTLHCVGADLVEMRGVLRGAMYEEESLWAWVGFAFDGTLVSAPTVGGSPKHFSSESKVALKDKGFVEDRTGGEARRGNVEYYAEDVIAVEILRQPALLKKALKKQISLLRPILDSVKG